MIEYTLSRYLVKPVYSILLCLGAIIGVSCLSIILSLFNNYYLSSEKVFMGIHPHIEIHREGMTPAEAQETVQKLKEDFSEITMIRPALYKKIRVEVSEVEREKAFCVKKNDHLECYEKVKNKAPLLERYGFNVLKKKVTDFMVKGIAIDKGNSVMEVKRLINGSRDLTRLSQNEDENNNPIPLGFYIEQGLFKTLSGYFLIHFPGVSDHPYQFWLNGAINMGMKKGEYPLLLMSLENAQKCLNMKNEINTIEVKIKKPYESEKIAVKIEAILENEFVVTTWIQNEKGAFTFLRVIKVMIFSIIFSISIVAAISVFSTLYLTVMQNRKKISILKALGIKDSSIYLLFIIKSLSIALTGVIIGTITGYAGSHLFILYFDDTLRDFGIKNPQVQISLQDISFITAATLIIFFLTAIIPARNAVKVDTVEGLQQS